MGKSGVQMAEPSVKLPIVKFQKNAQVNFALTSETEEVSIVEKISEKLNVKVRMNRLKKRMRNRSTNIL